MADVSRELHIQGEAAKALLLNIRDVVEDDAEMIETAIEGETNLKEAISAAVDRISECKAHALSLETREKDLSDRRQRFLDQAERIRASILVAMGHAEMRKLELPQATLSIRGLAPKVIVTDEALIPSKFWKAQDPKLDKKAILDALKAEETVLGAELSNGGETLSIGMR